MSSSIDRSQHALELEEEKGEKKLNNRIVH